MWKEVASGRTLNCDIGRGSGKSDRAAKHRAPHQAGAGADLVAGELAVNGGDDGDVLKRIDEINEVAEREHVLTPKPACGP